MFALFIHFFKLIFFFQPIFFLLLIVTFDDVFSLIAIIMTHCFFMIWFCFQESRYELGIVIGRV